MTPIAIAGLALSLAASVSVSASAQDMAIARAGTQASSKGPAPKHWHGAAPTTALTHIAFQEASGGKNVEWMEKVMEKVSDEQYGK
jgi:hypothetical protein